MAVTIQNFIKLANYYNQTVKLMSAICVQKGGVPIENYVGRFFAADILEYIVEYGARLTKTVNVPPEINDVITKFQTQYENVRSLVTPTQKPIHEMTLAEFEKLMNI